MTTQEFVGVSQKRSFEEALTDVLSQVEQFHKKLPGADQLIVAEVVNTTFRFGGIIGEDKLEVKVSITVS